MTRTDLQDHLYSLEERLLHPDREADRTMLLALLAGDFKEFSSSGRIYNRQQTIEALLKSDPRPATIHHYYVELLAEDVALATYRATVVLAVSHRSSLWVLRDGRWQIYFHQGTAAE